MPMATARRPRMWALGRALQTTGRVLANPCVGDTATSAIQAFLNLSLVELTRVSAGG